MAIAFVAVLFAAGTWINRPAGTAADEQKAAPASEKMESPRFIITPYLQYPTRDAITIMWETDVPCTSIVEYGPFGLTEKISSDKFTTIHEMKLTALKPKTRHYYKVTSVTPDGKTLVSKLLTFLTGVDADDAWSFTVIGDTQKNPKITGKIAKLMWDRRPHFVMHVGDVVDNGPDKREWIHELFGPSADLFGRVAVLPTIGNHERNHANYYNYFSLPAPEYYYRFRYGNADFFSIDTNKKVAPGSEQYEWLDKELSKSDATWKVCFHHHPAYSSDGDDYGNTWIGRGKFTEGDANARQLAALYERHGVDVVFNGHIHAYERTWPLRGGKVDRKAGTVYITSGGGGGRLEDFSPTPTWFKVQTRVDFHCCLINVQGDYWEFKAFDQEGRLFDSFELTKR
jgi:hypothetical protein